MSSEDIGASLAALRESGADRRDPVRFRFIEALAQRASTQQGAARRLLEAKLAGLLQTYRATPMTEAAAAPAAPEPVPTASPPMAAALPAAAAVAAIAPTTEPDSRPMRCTAMPAMASVNTSVMAAPAPAQATAIGPLGALVNQLAERSPSPSDSNKVPHEPSAASRPVAASAGARTALPELPELKALSYFRSTWSRLGTEQRLAQSAAGLPENAGPLNSQHLVHQSLVLMRDLSPGYLERFIAHVDALMWLDQLNNSGTK